jgi:hypothetical protein
MAMKVWRTGAWSLQIVKRSDAAGFEVRRLFAAFGQRSRYPCAAPTPEVTTPTDGLAFRRILKTGAPVLPIQI